MIAFKNLPGIVALSVMTASTLGAAAPTPSPEKAAGDAMLDFFNSFLGDNEGSSLQAGVGTIKKLNIQGTSVFNAPPKDAELKVSADFLGRADEEQATANLDFSISGAEISSLINSLSGSQVL